MQHRRRPTALSPLRVARLRLLAVLAIEVLTTDALVHVVVSVGLGCAMRVAFEVNHVYAISLPARQTVTRWTQMRAHDACGCVAVRYFTRNSARPRSAERTRCRQRTACGAHACASVNDERHDSPGSTSCGRARGRAFRILRRSPRRRPDGRAHVRATSAARGVRRTAGRRVPALPAKPGRVREGIRLREENTAADRIAVCSLEKKLSRRP